ncbi:MULTISPECIES: flagellar hook-basal body complex protein FliE [Alteromonadaceae]|uniref:flagellar hook-basal body complex protein FliE n=1 Tax=Alteromonadaceae TaxID=72275 RepID=UPI001C0A52D5|nr:MULTISPECIES: flagellar hook-basal body complex protein FliE [Aliiglaciecola]MBU2878018.1 flagellar hook-basal body complex protein FliE [Aliiglaciecola lipolytica]MDO6709383.1 flagellar hook-basal body complex protein FliE [Aliiglaciecola sp. 2_MG-2023]MDO6750531.1 flagellar hook-basal body complex protein FliE [Aliiglaciecola sp. 1_MG-2023]
MEIKAQSLYQEMQAMASNAQMDVAQLPGTNPSSHNFAEMLGQAINTVNDMQLDAKGKQEAFEMGDPNMSLADVMLTKEKSSIAFEATVQVRNKVLEAYKQIMNMPV